MSAAKPITSGCFPFGAVTISGRVAEAFESGRSGEGSIGSGCTSSGRPVCAAAAVAWLKETGRLQVMENAAARGSMRSTSWWATCAAATG